MSVLDDVMTPYNLETSVIKPDIKAEEPKRISPPGFAVNVIPTSLKITLEHAEDPKFLIPQLGAMPHGTSWTKPGVHEGILTFAREFSGHMKALAGAGDPLAIAEHDNASKTTLQSGGYPGWPVMPDAYIRSADGPWFALARAVVRALKTNKGYKRKGIRRHTSQGSPNWSTSDLSMIGHFALARATGTVSNYVKHHAAIAHIVGAPEDPVATTLSRSGPIGKHVAVYVKMGGATYYVGTAAGRAPRRRAVLGAPMTTAFLMQPLYERVIGYLLGTRCASATRSLTDIERSVADALRRFGELSAWNDDLGGFDQSVSWQAQDGLRDAMLEVWPDLADAIEAWHFSERMGVIAPGLGTEKAWIYPSKGMTHSGVLLTSAAGTLINLMRIVYCAVDQGWFGSFEAAAEWALYSGELLVLGDDTLIITKRAMNAERWASASGDIGFKSKILRGAMYLRRMFTATGSMPLAARILQQTAYNEHNPRTPALELLGAWARTLEAERNPHFPEVWHALRTHGDGLGRFLSVADLRAHVASEDFKAQVLEDATTGDNPWLLQREAVDDVGASPAQRKLAWLSEALGRPITNRANPEAAVEGMSQAELLELAYGVFEATTHSERHEPNDRRLRAVMGENAAAVLTGGM